MKKCNRFGALLLALVMTFVMSVTAFAAVEDTGFSDVDANAWYAEAVMYCKANNLMDGVGNGRFDPESNLTRAQLATVLYRIEGTPSVSGSDAFTDTADGTWYSNAVLWASQQGLVNGYGNGLFGTNDPVTREQMTAIIWRYAGSPAAAGENTYTDKSSVATYPAAALNWSAENGIVRPVSGETFAPKSSATRAQVADALMNFNRNQKGETTTPAEPTPTPETGKRILIAYFSATGTTAGVAENLNAILEADLYEITP